MVNGSKVPGKMARFMAINLKYDSINGTTNKSIKTGTKIDKFNFHAQKQIDKFDFFSF